MVSHASKSKKQKKTNKCSEDTDSGGNLKVKKTLLMRALTSSTLPADESLASPACCLCLKETTETVYCKCDNMHICVCMCVRRSERVHPAVW